jgi:hypothetical protein
MAIPKEQLPSGEFILNGNVVRSARRLSAYLQDLRHRDPEKSERSPKRVFHVIQPQYCEMLGINPDDMIAVSLGEVWAKKFEADIANNFAQLPPTMPLADKIFEAHLKAYGGGMDRVMKFVGERFFGRRD